MTKGKKDMNNPLKDIPKNFRYHRIHGFRKYILYKNGVFQSIGDDDKYSIGSIIPYVDNDYNVELYSDKYRKYVIVNALEISRVVFIGDIDLPFRYNGGMTGILSMDYIIDPIYVERKDGNIIISGKIFKPYPHSSMYYISDDGMVYNTKLNKFSKKHFDVKGYLSTDIQLDDMSWMAMKAHRLVWMTYNGEIPEDLKINHKNGNKIDNRIVNLELCTNAENMRHAQLNGLRHNARWTPEQIHFMCEEMSKNVPTSVIAEKLGYTDKKDRQKVYSVCKCLRDRELWIDISSLYDFSEYDVRANLTNSKLTEDEVKHIWSRLSNGESISSLSKEYNVSKSAISAIKTGKRWADVTGAKKIIGVKGSTTSP